MMIKGFTTATVMAFVALAQSTMTINTPPSIIVCQPAAVTWSGGTAPYYVSVLPAGQVAAAPIEYLVDGASETSYTWNVNLAANTNITLALRDSTGAVVYSAPLVIQAGSSTDCLNATATSLAAQATGGTTNETGGAGTGTAAATGGSGTTTENTAGSASPTTGGSSATGTGSGSSATSAAGTSETSKAAGSGAMGLSAPAGLVAVLATVAGAVAAVL